MLIETLSAKCAEIGLKKDKMVAIAVSGGCDSMALAISMHKYQQRSTCIIIDHGLRSSSKQQARQAQQSLQNLGIEAAVITWKHEPITKNMEAIARENRYKLLIKKATELGCEHLFLAHHADDQIETFLLNLLRGSGIDGLSSMPFVRKESGITIVRPFLELPKKCLESFLKDSNVSWTEDESNSDTKMTRNRLRKILQTMMPDMYKKRILLAVSHLQKSREVLDRHNLALFSSLVNKDTITDLDAYIKLSNTERTWLLNKIFESIGNKTHKTRMTKTTNLDNNIVARKPKSHLNGYTVLVRDNSVYFVKN